MKNKNIKNKPQKCGRWLFLHSRFSKIFRRRTPGPPLYKGNASLKPSKSSSNNNSSQRQKKKKKKSRKALPPFKQYLRNFSLGYTEIEKRRRALGQNLFCVICNWAVITLICAIAEDKVCESCIVSS